MAFFQSDIGSFGYKDQTSYFVPAATGAVTTWDWVPVSEAPSVTLARVVEQQSQVLTGVAMTSAAPITGSTDGGTLTFSAPLSGFLSTYDPTTDAADDILGNPLAELLVDFFGSTAFDAGQSEVDTAAFDTTVDANEWLLAAAPPTLLTGAMYSHGTGVSDILGINWIKDQVTLATTATLGQDGIALPADAENLYGSYTAFPAANLVPTPKTFRWMSNTTNDWRFVGCMPQTARLSMNPGESITVELTYVFTEHLRDTADALQTPAAYQSIPPLMGVNGARLWIGGWQDSAGGAADPTNDLTCVSEFSAEFSVTYGVVKCHGDGSQGQGVSERIVTQRECTINFSIPHDDAQDVSNTTTWEQYLVNGTPRSVTLNVGTVMGRIFGFCVPYAIVTAQPTYQQVGDLLMGFDVEMKASALSTLATEDVDSLGAGTSPVRLSWM